jgi:hypothetical protein
VQAVTPDGEGEALVFRSLHTAAGHLYEYGIDGIAYINDSLGHAAVLACFDQAIKDAE